MQFHRVFVLNGNNGGRKLPRKYFKSIIGEMVRLAGKCVRQAINVLSHSTIQYKIEARPLWTGRFDI